MNSFSKLIAFFSLILLCSKTFASEVGGTYFKSQGKEVAVEYTIDNYRNPTSVMFITTCNSDSECTGYQNMDILLEDFVKAIKYRRFYTYKYVDEPESSNISSQSNSETDNTENYDRSTAQTTSISVDTIIEQLKKNNSSDLVNLYTFRVIKEENKKIPTHFCKFDEDGTCTLESDVTVKSYNKDKVSVTYGKDFTNESQERESAIINMLRKLNYKCDIAYTGTSPKLVGHLACHYAS